MDALQKQQKDIAEALKEIRQDAKNAKPVAEAEQAANEAAQRLGQSDLEQALQSMKNANGAMQEAQQQNGPQIGAVESRLDQSNQLVEVHGLKLVDVG